MAAAIDASSRSRLGRFRRLRALIWMSGFLLLTACAAGPNDVARAGTTHLAGFWRGLWHGLIIPITFVISLFNHHVSVYEVHNGGNWYNFGFVLGIAIALGGSGSRARRRG